MYCRVLACDFDGTTADSGVLAPAVAEALRSARSRGFIALLVTGRVLSDLRAADLAPFDAVVVENGAIVWLPEQQHTIHLGARPPETFLAALRDARIPFHVGDVVVGTEAEHAALVLALIRDASVDAQLVFNRGALMVLPSGINKAEGVRRALRELGRSERNLIAFGDAENDLPMLEAAEVAVAPAQALDAVVAASDVHLEDAGTSGVARCIERVVGAEGVVPTPPRQRLVLGQDGSGDPVTLPSSGLNVLVSGDPRSGKSWLVGLIAERVLERGYRVCMVDPEGDHLAFGPQPGIMVMGDDIRLPAPETVVRIFRDEPVSLVLVLSRLGLPEKQDYVARLLAELTESRAEIGVPHWIFLDEAHYFLSAGARAMRCLESRTGEVLLATYRPSLLARSVLAQVGAYLLAETLVEEERSFVTGMLRMCGPPDVDPATALSAISRPRAGLLMRNAALPRWQVFTPGPRLVAHAHHGRKYADVAVPAERAFHFLHTGGPVQVARSTAEFCAAVRAVPLPSLEHHLRNGDFSRWAAGVLRDATLAHGLAKLERTAHTGGRPSRGEILRLLADRYLV